MSEAIILNNIIWFITGFAVSLLVENIIEWYKYCKLEDSIEKTNKSIAREMFIAKATNKIKKYENKKANKNIILNRVSKP